ncbi:MAG: hexulose-6-phosphate isomerase [Candidatus Nanopelagicales bacterium]
MAHDTNGSEPAHLNNRHLDTLTAIYSHPASGNIRWADVESLLGAVGTIEEKHDGKFLVAVGEETETFERPKGKDIDVQMVVDLRRMLRNAGYVAQKPGTEV